MKRLLFLSLLLTSPLYGGMRHISGANEGRDTTFLNLNFQDLDARDRNTVHKTSTETIRGYKNFNGVSISTLTVTSATITNLTVTSSPTINGLLYNMVPVGVVMPYASTTTIPTGWLQCQGQSVSTTTYARLFAVTGYVYGGSGANFNLPDLRGIFMKGHGTQGTASFASSNYAGTNGTYTQDKFQGHRHTRNPDGTNEYWGEDGAGTNMTLSGPSQRDNGTNTGSPVSDGINGTPRTAAVTEPASLALNFIIYAGI